MKYDPEKHHRHSIRLTGYDYTQAGAYFVTIVTQGREPVFDNVVLQGIAESFWLRLPQRFSHVSLDEWVVMPNHLHGILVISQDGPIPDPILPAGGVPPAGAPIGSLGAIIGAYKSTTTQRINRIRDMSGRQVWQRNYYERIIRSDAELDAIRRYIRDNPLNWPHDEHHPHTPAA